MRSVIYSCSVSILQGPPKQINRKGTRLAVSVERGDTPSSKGTPVVAAARTAVDEYSVLATPSFTPGVEDSPFMTWGDVEGTPLRLDAEDDVIVQPDNGPQFRVPQVTLATPLPIIHVVTHSNKVHE